MKLRNLFAGVLALIIAFTFAACAEKENEKNDQVSDVHSQNTDGSNGDLLTYLVLKESVTYNPDGSVYQQINVEQNGDGLPVAVTVEGERGGTMKYTYNGQYAVASLDYEQADGDREYYEFNASGDNLKMDTYKAGTLDSSAEYRYDEGGRLIGKSSKGSKGDKELAYEYKLDEQGRIIEELEFVNGKEYHITEIEYDDRGNEIRYSGGYIGDDPYIRVSEYDDAGRLKKTTEYTGDVEDAYTEYTYDDRGNILKYVTMKNGVEDAFEKYQYDEQGNVVKFTYCHDSMNVRHYEYEYDQNNVLCKESYYIKGELIHYTVFTWYSQAVRLSKNVALAIQREFPILEEA